MKNVTVIGAGTMGNGIAHVFAVKGFKVQLVDISEDALARALQIIEKNLDRMIKKERITIEDKNAALACITTETNLSKGVLNADIVIEAATENLDLKLNLFKQMDQHAPESAILATNTSSISITQMASVTTRPEKVIGMHFMNPVPIMKLVEVIKGYSTSDEVCTQVFEMSKKLGKVPVEVNDYPGFVANRILMPMINEAILTLHEGVAGVPEIDTVMMLGMAHPMGPLKLADFIGLDVCLAILDVLYNGFKLDKYAPCPLLVNMVRAGNLGVKSGVGFYDYTEDKRNPKIASSFI